MTRPFPYILLLLFFMSSLCLGWKNKKTGKSYIVRHKNRWWKIKTTGEKGRGGHGGKKGHGGEKGHDYQEYLDDDTDDSYTDYQNQSNDTASNDTASE